EIEFAQGVGADGHPVLRLSPKAVELIFSGKGPDAPTQYGNETKPLIDVIREGGQHEVGHMSEAGSSPGAQEAFPELHERNQQVYNDHVAPLPRAAQATIDANQILGQREGERGTYQRMGTSGVGLDEAVWGSSKEMVDKYKTQHPAAAQSNGLAGVTDAASFKKWVDEWSTLPADEQLKRSGEGELKGGETVAEHNTSVKK